MLFDEATRDGGAHGDAIQFGGVHVWPVNVCGVDLETIFHDDLSWDAVAVHGITHLQ